MSLQTAISLLVIGLLAGGIATLILKRKGLGLIANLVIGTAGAFLGYFVLRQINGQLIMILFAAGGATLLLWLISLFKK
ncbi:MAG TPA: hypothetical protein VL357_10695 [Rariglobus sp.]|jgi:uncharacterized membrane protein YeaQ/YmgE (transglycosylase-associated protein family)|nr:hypothetical protein [Rariglobus sp.]